MVAEHGVARADAGSETLRIVAISDTHGRHAELAIPDGDVLIHAGDLSRAGALEEIAEAGAFLRALPHRHKIVVAGNHDWCFQREPERARELLAGTTYLEDDACAIGPFRFYGSPWQPWFLDWAFNLPRGERLRAKWAAIPAGTHVLVTHTPPEGVLDRVWSLQHVGCEELAPRVRALAPALHVFGHIHEARGSVRNGATLYVNASSLDRRYRETSAPYVIDLMWRDGAAHAELVGDRRERR
jgi:predicted phosphodiesterase